MAAQLPQVVDHDFARNHIASSPFIAPEHHWLSEELADSYICRYVQQCACMLGASLPATKDHMQKQGESGVIHIIWGAPALIPPHDSTPLLVLDAFSDAHDHSSTSSSTALAAG